MTLREVLDTLVTSEPFERLLLDAPGRSWRGPRQGRTSSRGTRGRAGRPLMVVSPGPREAEELASEIGAYLGPEGVALLPAWDALPYEGMDPAPEVAARRADALGRLRFATGPFVVVAPVPRGHAGGAADPRDGPGPAARGGRGDRAGHARGTALGAGLCPGRRGRASGGVRRPGRRRRRVPRHRAPPCPARVLGRRDRAPPRVLAVDAALDQAGGRDRGLTGARAPARRRASGRSAAERAAHMPDRFRDGLQRLADGLRFEGADTLAPFLFDHMPTPAELLPARLLDRGDPRPAHVPTRRADPRGGRGARRGDRVAGPEGAPADRGSDRGSRAAASDRVHRGTRPRHLGLGDRRGQPGRAGASSRAGRGRRHEDRARRPRPRLAAASRRGPGDLPVERSRGARSRRVRVRARPSRRRHRGGPVRLPPAHAERAEVRERRTEAVARRARTRRLRGPPDPRRRPRTGAWCTASSPERSATT